MDDDLLPLFPLEVVLLPEESLPLHIFEERYKRMIRECLQATASGQGQQEFGVVMAKGQELSTLGCTARIMDVTRQYKDGRMDILTVGQRRFEILLTNTERPYLRGAVDYFDDKGPDAPSEERAERVIKIFRDAMRRLRHAADMPDHLALPYRRLSFRLAAALPVDLEFKQQLLALRNETERLASLQRALEVFLKQLERVQESQRKVGGNGHARR